MYPTYVIHSSNICPTNRLDVWLEYKYWKGACNSAVWLEYKYRKAHPILRWLPSKLAEYIGDNYGDELGIPRKADPNGWNVQELNYILLHCLVGLLRMFGMLEWECELFEGRPRARCFPFNLPGCKFYGKTRQVPMKYLCSTYICHIAQAT